MKFTISVATRRADVLRCQYFIAETYHRRYGIMFSEDLHDIEARIEPYPHRYLVGSVDGELVATLGLYERDTYVARYGGITDEDIAARLAETGMTERYAGATWRELTKLVVRDDWAGHQIARQMVHAGHSRAFTEMGTTVPVLLMACGRPSLFNAIYAPRGAIRSSYLAPFPRYPVHAAYRRDDDPMESRLIIPEVDVPEEIRALEFPLVIEVPEATAPGATAPGAGR